MTIAASFGASLTKVAATASLYYYLLYCGMQQPVGGSPETLDRVLRRHWAALVVGIAMVEGAVILGFLTFLVPSLGSVGVSPVTAGLVVGFYRLVVLAWTRAVKRFASRLGPTALILIGATMLALGYALGTGSRLLAGAGVAAVLVGGVWSPCTPRCRPGPPRWCRRHAPRLSRSLPPPCSPRAG